VTIQLQRDMDEAQTPIILQNKILSRIFGGKVNDGAEKYTLMGWPACFVMQVPLLFF
jgi:hypothetical protein